MERKLIAALMVRSAFEQLRHKIDPKTDLSSEGQVIYREIVGFFNADPKADRVDPEIISARIGRSVSNPKHVKLFHDLIASFPTDVSSINVIAEWLAQRRDITVNTLRTALITPGETKPIRDAIDAYLTYDQSDADTAYDVVSDFSADYITEATSQANRMPILPTSLNRLIGGGAQHGNFVFFFARPEVGKTCFALNMLRQPAREGKQCLYIGNEDPLREAIIPRAIESFAGVGRQSGTWSELLDLASNAGLKNVRFVGAFPGSVGEVNELVETYKPELVIVDQVGNLAVKDDSYTLQLGKVMRGLRTLTKKHGIVTVGLHQAGDSASNKLNLDMGDVSWSNTDMAAQADLMVGMGCNENYEVRGLRRLNVIKNKLNGWHGFIDVTIDPVLSRMKSI